MTKDNLENLANEMANCTKTLLRIVEALENEMNNSTAEPEKVIPERKALSEYTDTILPCARTFFTTLPQLFDHPSGSICHPAQ